MKNLSFFKNVDAAGRYVLICCFFVFAVNGLYGMILGSLLPLISAEYALNNTISGSLISAHQAGNLIAGFIAGVLPIYMGRKKAIMFLCLFVMVGFLIMILTGNPVLLILGFIFTGISRGSISNFNNAVVNEVSGSSSAALNLLHSTFAVGALAAPFLVILCTNLFGDRGWKVASIIIIVLCGISVFMFSKIKIDDKAKVKDKGNLSYAFITDKFFLINAGILFFYLCAEAAINGWIVKYFVDTNIMTREYAQMLASILWFVILIGRLTCAAIGDKVPKKVMLTVTSVGLAVCYGVLLSSRDLTVITAMIVGVGFFMAGIYPTTISNVGSIIKKYPMSMGVLLIVGGLGGIVMPMLTGVLADQMGFFAGMAAIFFALVLLIVCVVLNLFYKQKEN